MKLSATEAAVARQLGLTDAAYVRGKASASPSPNVNDWQPRAPAPTQDGLPFRSGDAVNIAGSSHGLVTGAITFPGGGPLRSGAFVSIKPGDEIGEVLGQITYVGEDGVSGLSSDREISQGDRVVIRNRARCSGQLTHAVSVKAPSASVASARPLSGDQRAVAKMLGLSSAAYAAGMPQAIGDEAGGIRNGDTVTLTVERGTRGNAKGVLSFAAIRPFVQETPRRSTPGIRKACSRGRGPITGSNPIRSPRRESLRMVTR